jgi:hypothetical protein
MRQDGLVVNRETLPGVTPTVGAQAAVWECQWCGKDFPEWLRTPGRRYCSGKCADAAYNRAHPVARQRALPLTPPATPGPARRPTPSWRRCSGQRARGGRGSAIAACGWSGTRG